MSQEHVTAVPVDFQGVRRKPEATSPRRYWKSLDELADAPAFLEFLSVLPTRTPLLCLQHSDFQAVPVDGVVLELKFTERSPSWLTETVRALGLRRRSFSKYAHCVAALAPRHGRSAC